MFGNLLCISMNGQFDDVIWTTVAGRDQLQSKQIVLVELCSELNSMLDVDSIEILTDTRGKGVAAESPTYYRAYGPILKALQQQNPNELPFKEELIDVRQTGSPEFFNDSSTIVANCIMRNPPPSDMTLPLRYIRNLDTIFDDSQLNAMENCLGQKIGIIQGPPGTGKTFIGVKLVQLLLSLSSKPSGPILVLTYKNHALDEFLKALIEVGIKNVARVGGGSKEAAIDEVNVKNLERGKRKEETLFQQMKEMEEALDFAETEVKKAFDELAAAKVFSVDAFLSFVNGKQLHDFLMKCPWENSLFKTFEVAGLIKDLSYEDLKSSTDPRLKQLIKDALNLWRPSLKEATDFENRLSAALNWVSHDSAFCEDEKEVAEDENASDDEDEVKDMLLNRKSVVDDGRTQFKMEDLMIFDQRNGGGDAIRLYECATEFLENFPTHVFSNINDFWKVKKEDRLKLVQFITHGYYKAAGERFKEKTKEYEQLCSQFNELRNRHKTAILKGRDVVAMTITGASISYDLLQELQPAIVIVEEAAELLEAQLVAALGNWTKQLILIGDHKQLRPSVETYYLQRDYNMDISLMERLIENDFQYSTLHKQNRMRPEFSKLLLDIYPDLKDNLERVKDNKPAICLKSSSFFWHHEHPEVSERSAWNVEEADRAVRLAGFMVQQGIEPGRITILSAYKGQNALIRKKLKDPIIAKLLNENGGNADNRIVTHSIDNYQGDENDFVIISLVRSNESSSIGFLKFLNRRCVAQSRARCGMYFIGNVKMFALNKDWRSLLGKMSNDKLVVRGVTLVCPKHSSSQKIAKSATDIDFGTFCKVKCGFEKECGHVCATPCQPPHSHLHCAAICTEKCKTCGNQCRKSCRPTHDHQRCDNVIEKQLPCHHTVFTPCEEDSVVCMEMVSFVSKRCGHNLERLCHDDEDKVKCKKPCPKRFPCGHLCSKKCWQQCIPEKCDKCEKLKQIEAMKRAEEEEKIRKLRKEEEEKKIKELMEKIELEPTEIELSKTEDEYYTVQDKVQKYIQPTHKWYPEVTKIVKVINYRLEANFRKAKLLMVDPEMRSELKFHGTSKEAIENIIKEGFRLPNKAGMYGKGVYFATDSSKSAQDIYTKGRFIVSLNCCC